MHEGTGHFFFVLDADGRLQHRAQQHVVVGGVFSKLFIEFHGQDVHTLVPSLDADHGPRRFPFTRIGLANRVPFLHQLSTRDAHHRNAHQSHIVVFVLFLFLVRIPVEVDGDVLDGREVVELEVFAPEYVVCLEFAGRAGIQGVIQAEFAEVLFLGRKVLGFDDPKPERVLYPSAVVLEMKGTVRSAHSWDMMP